jgi:methyl-accepting chemotaxis protein
MWRRFAQLPATAWRRAVVVAVVVGTLLTLINQWDALAAWRVDIVKAALTYLVPFCVSVYSAAANGMRP